MARNLSPRPIRRVVVKVGSAVLAPNGVLDPDALGAIATDIAAWLGTDTRLGARQCIIVSSGAVASGFRPLGLKAAPKLISLKQAAAAVGQPLLMRFWGQAFAAAPHARHTAQVLLTSDDIDDRTRFLNARHTLERLLEASVVPIINENDSVSYAEIKLGDNDRLSALVANLVGADVLIILSSVPGVFARGKALGRSTVVPVIDSLDFGLSCVTTDKSATGVGGMATKIRAACAAAAEGVAVVIADGGSPGVIGRVLAGDEVGTLFPAAPRPLASRKRWIGGSARPKGTIVVDAGAKEALLTRGASLLPSGVKVVDGRFDYGALVEISGPDGIPFARGLTSYNSADLIAIQGKKALQIEQTLGYRYADEAVHRDDLVLLVSSGRGRGAAG